jgi:predicted enzyme related to lactoylglutathione lyase
MYFAFHVPDTARAKDFYHAVFGWTYDSNNGYHHIKGSSPAGGITSGDTAHVEPSLVVEDAAAAVAMVRELGGTAPDPTRSESGWSVRVKDGHGGGVELWQPAEGFDEPEPKSAEGDLFYFVLPVANDEAKSFYTSVLGWELTPGSHPGGWNIVNVAPPGGLFVSAPKAPDLYFRVADVDAAKERILAAGGTAGDTQPNTHGHHAACADDQGTAFSIGSVGHS